MGISAAGGAAALAGAGATAAGAGAGAVTGLDGAGAAATDGDGAGANVGAPKSGVSGTSGKEISSWPLPGNEVEIRQNNNQKLQKNSRQRVQFVYLVWERRHS